MPDSPADFFNVSGAAHNYSRFSSTRARPRPPNRSKTKPKADAKQWTASEAKSKRSQEKPNEPLPVSPLVLDLENFDDPRHEDSKYVLTSPRSLDACAQIGAKPVDLLYRNLQDFEEDYPEWAVKDLFALYEREEEKRQDLLKRSRQIRNRIIEEENAKQSAGHAANGTTNTAQDAATSKTAKKIRTQNLDRSSPRPPSRTRSSEDVRRTSNRAPSTASTSSLRRRTNSTDLLRKVRTSPTKDDDRKRLELMLAKKEEEIAERDSVREAQLENESARQRELMAAQAREAARRRQAAVADYEWRLKQERLKKELQTQQEAEAESLQQVIEEREANHQRLLQLQQKEKEREMWERRRQEQTKQRRVSNNLAEAASQLEEYQHSVREDSEKAIEESVLRKLRKELSESQAKKLENLMKMEAFRYRKQANDKKKDRQIDDVRRNVDVRNAVVEKNQQRLAREQARIKAETTFDRRRKMTAAQERRTKLEEERQAFQEQLQQFQKMSFDRANENLRRKQFETSQRIHDQHFEKSQQHQMKLDEVQRTEEEWKAEISQLLDSKEQKVRQIQEEREAKIRENRLTAYTAERLREEIRKAYGQDSFERKLDYVTTLNKMGLGGSDQLA